MREYIEKEIAKDIAESCYDVLLVGFEEEKEKFPLTMAIIDFIVDLKEKNITLNMSDIFNSTFLDKMYVEASDYIGK